jgi:beta-phosphoglucomutase
VADRAMVAFLGSLATRAVEFEPLYGRKQELFRKRSAEVELCTAETIELVRSLRDYRLAVVTSSGRAEVEPVLERAGIRERLAAMVFGEDVERHKPAPDPYLLAASLVGAQRPLVVEDSAAGVASARAAGFDVIRVGGSAEVARVVRNCLLDPGQAKAYPT